MQKPDGRVIILYVGRTQHDERTRVSRRKMNTRPKHNARIGIGRPPPYLPPHVRRQTLRLRLVRNTHQICPNPSDRCLIAIKTIGDRGFGGRSRAGTHMILDGTSKRQVARHRSDTPEPAVIIFQNLAACITFFFFFFFFFGGGVWLGVECFKKRLRAPRSVLRAPHTRASRWMNPCAVRAA